MNATGLLVISMVLLPLPVAAGTAEQQRARVEQLENAVLAPCCYTEPVSRHQSEIAVKMRLEIAKWVAAGKSDREILDTYVGLYGAKVLVDPRTVPRGWMPFVPWFVLVLRVFVAVWFLRRWRNRPTPQRSPGVVDAERADSPDLDDD